MGGFCMDTEQQGVTTDELLEVVADPRRRLVLRYLCDNGEQPVTVGELATHLAAEAGGTDGPEDTRPKRIPLEHVHLPKLDAAGLVDFDGRTVSLRTGPRERTRQLLQFIDEELE